MNNGWNQWVLNYTQGKQLNLLKDIGFESPSWRDLSYLLIGIVVLASLAGAAWALWERTQHDPWLRLLNRASLRLAKAGIISTPATSPRQLAAQVMASAANAGNLAGRINASQGQALADWLMQLERHRYASPGAAAANHGAMPGTTRQNGNNGAESAKKPARRAPLQQSRQLEQLRQQFKKLDWPK